jgi:phosphoglycolate phosphatase
MHYCADALKLNLNYNRGEKAVKNQAVIFDLDGTLVDTLVDLAETCNAILAEFGFLPHPVDAYRYFVGNGLRRMIEQILPEGEEDKVEQGLALFQTLYAKNWQKNAEPYAGIHEALQSLSSRGLQLAVLSNKPHDFTCMFVDYYFPEKPFRLVYGQQPGGPRKPDPSMAIRILEELKCDAEHSVFVGDTAMDILTGVRAGMKTIGVKWGFREEKELRDSGASVIIEHPSQLLEQI